MNWQRLILVLLACVSPVLAGPTVRVSVDATGDAAGLLVQAYRAALRGTPGVLVVALEQAANAMIQMASVTAQAGSTKVGYAWGLVVLDPNSRTVLMGPEVLTSGRTYQDILQAASGGVVDLDQKVFSPLRQRENTGAKAAPSVSPHEETLQEYYNRVGKEHPHD